VTEWDPVLNENVTLSKTTCCELFCHRTFPQIRVVGFFWVRPG
jgi:hypothetical protein